MNRHDTDPVSLVSGLVFAALVGWWLVLRWMSVASPGPGWYVAVALLVLGALGILTTLGSWRRRKIADPQPDEAGQARGTT